MTVPVRRKRTWVIITLSLILLAVMGLAYLTVLARGTPDVPEYREQNFPSDAQRIAFIRSVTKLPIPESARNIRLHYVGWLDYDLDCSFELPIADFDTFLAATNSPVPPATPAQNAPAESHRTCQVTHDSVSHRIIISCNGD